MNQNITKESIKTKVKKLLKDSKILTKDDKYSIGKRDGILMLVKELGIDISELQTKEYK